MRSGEKSTKELDLYSRSNMGQRRMRQKHLNTVKSHYLRLFTSLPNLKSVHPESSISDLYIPIVKQKATRNCIKYLVSNSVSYKKLSSMFSTFYSCLSSVEIQNSISYKKLSPMYRILYRKHPFVANCLMWRFQKLLLRKWTLLRKMGHGR